MSKINVKTKTNIKLQVRIQVLYDVISNLSASFGFPNSLEDILYKGIVEKQIFESIYAYYITDDDKVVGKVEFNIDWKTHNIYASTDTGKNIEVNTNMSILEQFGMWAKDLIKYMEIMQKKLNVTKIKVFFRYKEEIRKNPKKDSEADKFLGLVKSKFNCEYDNSKSKEFDRIMSFTSEMLPELEVKISSNIK